MGLFRSRSKAPATEVTTRNSVATRQDAQPPARPDQDRGVPLRRTGATSSGTPQIPDLRQNQICKAKQQAGECARVAPLGRDRVVSSNGCVNVNLGPASNEGSMYTPDGTVKRPGDMIP